MAQGLDGATFILLALLALASVVSPKAMACAIPVAVVWLAKLVVQRRAVSRLPLVAPMLALLIAVTLASWFAYDPIASWTRVRMFGALLIAVIIGETCTSLARLKVLSYALFLSALIAVGWTIWQYKFGIGVQFRDVPPAMVRAGIVPDDIVMQVNGVRVRTPQAWEKAIRVVGSSGDLTLHLLRAQSDERLTAKLPAREIFASGLDRAGAVVRGHSARASGFYQHYVPFSEVLTLIAVLLWGLAITAQGFQRWIFAGIFLVLTVSLATTVTRTAMAVLLFSCVLLLWRLVGWKVRVATLAAVMVLVVMGSFWIQHTRGMGWLAPKDAGTQYRLMMWRDGLRLAAHHPVLGVGFDNVVRHPEHWNIEAYRLFPLISHFHSTPIEYAVDGGLLTLAAWLWLLGAYFMLLIRITGAPVASRFASGLGRGLLGALIAFFIMSLVQYTGGDSDVMTVFWLMMGMAIALDGVVRNSPQTSVT